MHIAIMALALTGSVLGQDGCRSMNVSAYSAEALPGIMASGPLTGPNVGTAVAVGVDSRGRPLIPFGTVLWIEGIGERVVMDTGLGGAGWLDVLMQTTGEAVQHGRRSMLVCR